VRILQDVSGRRGYSWGEGWPVMHSELARGSLLLKTLRYPDAVCESDTRVSDDHYKDKSMGVWRLTDP
jgi:hypothetical protein